jgi:2-polyprenyl-6-methoxyphenol hydroxylase-like FAD-dependent oxidoreductase
MALEAIFPGLAAEIMAAGVEPMDVAHELAWLTPAGWTPRFRSGITILPCSRDLLEWRIRERVRANETVEIRDGHEATGLVLADARSVVGARVRPTDRRDLDGAEIRSDLVVDASGRGSRLPRWLQELGLEAPRETVVDAQVVYTSRVFRGRAAMPDGLRGAFLQAAPPVVQRGGAMLPIEGDRTLVTLIGRGGDDPPSDDAGFLAYASTLRSPLIHDAIADLQPLSPIATSRATRNRCRHYELVRGWPDGLAVLGDAACAFNPVYGQGMSSAVLAAAALGRLLGRRRGRSGVGLGRRFQQDLAGLNAGPWALDTALDLRARGVTGPAPGQRTRARQAYLVRVARLGTERRDARLSWLRVFHMLRPASTLVRPGIVVRVMVRAASERRASRRSSRAGPPSSP